MFMYVQCVYVYIYIHTHENRLIVVQLIFFFSTYKLFYYVISMRYCFVIMSHFNYKIVKQKYVWCIRDSYVKAVLIHIYYVYRIQFYCYFTALVQTLYFKQKKKLLRYVLYFV